jgi:hypothetical protein
MWRHQQQKVQSNILQTRASGNTEDPEHTGNMQDHDREKGKNARSTSVADGKQNKK